MLYRDLKEGERFTFRNPYVHEQQHERSVHTKLRGRWYRCGNSGGRFTTGAATGVRRVAADNEQSTGGFP
jgi:hypothetical protein